MTDMTLEERFEQFQDDFLKFEKIESPLHRRPDLCAFLLLDSLSNPSDAGRDMVSAAEHDVIYMDVDVEELAAKITDDQVLVLVRCGVSYDSDNDGLMMFA